VIAIVILLAIAAIGEGVWVRYLLRRVASLKAAEIINAQLAHELERKHGTKKALRLLHSAEIQIRQARRAAEV
jgi:hypothetical protein